MDNQFKFSKRISAPIGILIIVVCAVLAGGISSWQLELFKKEVKIQEEATPPVINEKEKEEATKEENETLCDKISDNKNKSRCYYYLALKKNDSSLCYLTEDFLGTPGQTVCGVPPIEERLLNIIALVV